MKVHYSILPFPRSQKERGVRTFMSVLSAMIAPPGTMRLLSSSCKAEPPDVNFAHAFQSLAAGLKKHRERLLDVPGCSNRGIHLCRHRGTPHQSAHPSLPVSLCSHRLSPPRLQSTKRRPVESSGVRCISGITGHRYDHFEITDMNTLKWWCPQQTCSGYQVGPYLVAHTTLFEMWSRKSIQIALKLKSIDLDVLNTLGQD